MSRCLKQVNKVNIVLAAILCHWLFLIFETVCLYEFSLVQLTPLSQYSVKSVSFIMTSTRMCAYYFYHTTSGEFVLTKSLLTRLGSKHAQELLLKAGNYTSTPSEPAYPTQNCRLLSA